MEAYLGLLLIGVIAFVILWAEGALTPGPHSERPCVAGCLGSCPSAP